MDEKINFKSYLDKNRVSLTDLQTKSRKWLFAKSDEMQAKGLTPRKLLKDPLTKIRSKVQIGELYFYNYDPKHKETLPYYDKFPLVFPFAPADGGFIGLNMHYLPYVARAQLFQALYNNRTDKFITENKRLKINWEIIQGISKFPLAAPCVKRYLYNHVRSEFTLIDSSDWTTALLMPVARFAKRSEVYVWGDSLNYGKT